MPAKKYFTDAERKKADCDKQFKYRSSPKGRARADKQLRERHGLSLEGRAWMLEQQGGACAIVGCNNDATEVDHDHEDGHVRGMLCFNCNTSIGKLGDNAAGLQRAHQYLVSQEPA